MGVMMWTMHGSHEARVAQQEPARPEAEADQLREARSERAAAGGHR
jgi:hypothetical protein